MRTVLIGKSKENSRRTVTKHDLKVDKSIFDYYYVNNKAFGTKTRFKTFFVIIVSPHPSPIYRFTHRAHRLVGGGEKGKDEGRNTYEKCDA